jgi:hypothetical protein
MRLSAVRCTGLLLIGVAATLSACARSAPPPPLQPTLAPTMTIERFLRAANQNDLDTMAALFGTREGSINRLWSRREADDRMFLLASLLRHTDYRIEAEQVVPGRREEATQFTVRLQVAQGSVPVPFTLVQSRGQLWLIEQIGIERITHPGRRP